MHTNKRHKFSRETEKEEWQKSECQVCYTLFFKVLVSSFLRNRLTKRPVNQIFNGAKMIRNKLQE
jgi:hypothetical protein